MEGNSIFGVAASSPVAASNVLRSSYSNASMPVDNPLSGINTSAQGSTYRGPFSSWLNQSNIEKEDFSRAEQSANNSFLRDLYMTQYNNQFNASEAQKARDFQVDFAKNSYKYVVEGMKSAGLNPVLAYQNGAAQAPSVSSAHSSGSSSRGSSYRGSNYRDDAASLVGTVIRVLSGMYLGNLSAQASAVGLLGQDVYNLVGEDGYSSRHVYYHYGKK